VHATIPTILLLPGLGNSGPRHWQSVWHSEGNGCVRIQQRDWDRPELSEWLSTLQAIVSESSQPLVLVAHSLSCSLVAHFAARHGSAEGRIRAALLVAPADVDSTDHTPPETRSFAPLPLALLPFPSTVVASQNDPFVTFERARGVAHAWGAEFVDAGTVGHINADSELGAWLDGKRCLARLLERAAR
jgi:uncharacterized protein